MKIKRIILLLILMLFSVFQTGYSVWMFKPEESNALKGDIILSSDPDSAIGNIMNCLGHYWDHCMMITDDSGSEKKMTHNTFNMSDLERIVDYHRYYVVGKKVKLPYRFYPVQLSNGSPGILTEEARSEGAFKARLTIQNEDSRVYVHEIADYMKDFSGYYILNAYAKVKEYEPVYWGERSYGNGSHCSGTIWWASKYSGKLMSLFRLDNSEGVISSCASVMHTYVRDSVRKMIKDRLRGNYTKEIRDEAYRQITSKNGYDCDDKLAHQVVNTFLFNRSDRTDDYWKKHINSLVIESIAPDHLLMMGMPDKNGKFALDSAMGGRQQSFTSYYDAITDYSKSGGYYYNIENGTNSPPVDPIYQTVFDTPCEMGLGVQCCE
ncbi:MAG TPA: hypothetical protein PK926_07195 [Spirochaetota bacterium]|nr:hypothetical protein [Spirochaetota bacterium]HPI90393.1 hypothetical protein [Spirochaetota bacterium]HPR48524.1 hypothetical protein [Spirochaetota bacterium]